MDISAGLFSPARCQQHIALQTTPFSPLTLPGQRWDLFSRPPGQSDASSERVRKLTVEEALDLQVSDAQAEHGELVQAGPDLLGEGQQAGELVQLPVEPVSVAFGRVGLDAIGRRWFWAGGSKT